MKTTSTEKPKRPVDSRRPYEKPAIVSEQEFETLALSCQGSTACGPFASS